MEDFMEFLVAVGFVALMVYANKKNKEKKTEELKRAEEQRQRAAASRKSNPKKSSNDIVRRRQEQQKLTEEINKRRQENEKQAKEIEKRRAAQQAEADSSRIHTSIHEKEEAEYLKKTNAIAEAVAAKNKEPDHKIEKYDFEDQDLMKEVEDLIAFGYDGSDFLKKIEKDMDARMKAIHEI